MERKQLALVAVMCGGLTFIGVLMPWFSWSMSGTGFDMPSQSLNGTQGDFNGVFVLILALAGAAAAILVWAGKTDLLPLDERQHLFVALALFVLAAIVTLLDVMRDIPSVSMGGLEAGKSFGMYVTLLAAIAGAGASFLAAQKPGSET